MLCVIYGLVGRNKTNVDAVLHAYDSRDEILLHVINYCCLFEHQMHFTFACQKMHFTYHDLSIENYWAVKRFVLYRVGYILAQRAMCFYFGHFHTPGWRIKVTAINKLFTETEIKKT